MNEKSHVEYIPSTPQETCAPSGKKLRVAAYCRVSTNQEEQQHSYQAQCEYYTKKIAENPAWTMAGIFADRGITGTSAEKRPEFMRMIRWCRKGKIDLVITKSISRFSRNTIQCLEYIRQLRELKIPVIFEEDDLNTLLAESELMIALKGAFAQAESELISKRVKWGIRQSFSKGVVRYNFDRWYGYRRGTDGMPEIVPEDLYPLHTGPEHRYDSASDGGRWNYNSHQHAVVHSGDLQYAPQRKIRRGCIASKNICDRLHLQEGSAQSWRTAAISGKRSPYGNY